MIRVGNQRGLMNYKKLREVALSTLILIIIIDLFFCVVFLLFNNYLPLLYLDPSDPSNLNDVNEVLGIASKLLIVAGVFQIFDWNSSCCFRFFKRECKMYINPL